MTKETCVGEMVILHLDHAEVESREWQRHDFHFDNVIDAFLSLFTFSTGAGWPDGMWASIESTQELVHAHLYRPIFIFIRNPIVRSKPFSRQSELCSF